ncbi:MAG TPA: hypothetical protein VFF27_07855 [Bacteroidia bacterium]|jgi:hypothetical protein|nr:hypothetical protein [Bacteroidia bacterium]
MKKNLILLAGLLSSSFACISQNFSYPNVAIKTVTYSQGLAIQKDDGTGAYSTPQWSSSNSSTYPVAYVSGKKATVAGTFSLTCDKAPDYVWIKGVGPESIEFPGVKVTITSSSSPYSISYPATEASKAFETGVTRFFKPFTINWQVSFDDGKTYRDIGASANTVYVTKTTPMDEFSNSDANFKWYHSVFDISCRNADKKSSETDIISSVWSEFTDHIVLNYNGDSLFYYKTMNTPYVTLGSLLKYKNAECYTFAQLFLSLIKIQGIVRTNNYIYIEADGSSVCGNYSVDRFIVKDWIFGTQSGSCPDFPYENSYSTLIPSPYTAYKFSKADVQDGAGIPGSCTKNPASFFNNHQISKIDGVYYDACYGATFSKITDIKTQAFSGWSYRYNGNDGLTHACFTKDMSQADLLESVDTY